MALAAGCASGSAPEGPRVLSTTPPSELEPGLELLREVRGDARLEGEFGLLVRESEDSLEVRWITETEERGLLEAKADGTLLHRVETPSGIAHGVVFGRPRGGHVELEYGTLDEPDARHVTVVRPGRPEGGESRIEDVDSLFVVGDVHGQYGTLRRLLAHGGLIDDEGGWSGGAAHLVVLGDVFDRGPDVTRTLWFLYGLEEDARTSGGGVHVVLGNHEIMVLTGDLRYVSSKEQTLALVHGTSYPDLFDVERTVLGRWIASRPGLLQVDEALLAHGGVAEPYRKYGVREFNDTLAAFMDEELFHRWRDTTYAPPLDSASYARRIDFFYGDESVFWFRDYMRTDTAGALLDSVLERHGARVHVIAHTPVRTIAPRYGGRLVPVDLARPATEMLLLERIGDGYRAYRHGLREEPDLLTDVP